MGEALNNLIPLLSVRSKKGPKKKPLVLVHFFIYQKSREIDKNFVAGYLEFSFEVVFLRFHWNLIILKFIVFWSRFSWELFASSHI